MADLKQPIAPMEALAVGSIPHGSNWQYEPKWDGFRCLAFRNNGRVFLQSKSEKPLGRYFPEVITALENVKADRFILDGELAVPVNCRLNFDQLLQRIHPAESRIQKLAEETPAIFIVFDILADPKNQSLMDRPLSERRPLLEQFAKRFFKAKGLMHLSPATTRLAQANKWLGTAGGNLDGVIAKRLDVPYRSGEREGMVKIKRIRSADCVVGGFRYGTGSKLVGSLLLGLYDEDGLLHHVGFTSSIKHAERPELTKRLEKLIGPPGFTGKAPGGPSRWSTKRTSEWKPLQSKLVVEVEYDHFSGDRFRHGTSFLRWRPDKAPRQCRMDQVLHRGAAVKLLKLMSKPSKA